MRFEGHKEAAVRATGTKLEPGATTHRYDANGNLVRLTDLTKSENNRQFVNDLAGARAAAKATGSSASCS